MQYNNFVSVSFTRKGWDIMNLGKDFWFILKILRIIVEILSKLGKEENDETPNGQE